MEVITVDIQHGACLKVCLLGGIILLMNYSIQKSHKFYLILYSVFQEKMLFFRHLLCMKLQMMYLYLSSLDSVRSTLNHSIHSSVVE